LKRIGVIFHTDRPLIKEVTQKIVDWAELNDIEVCLSVELADRVGSAEVILPADDIWKCSDVILTLGGDGSMLASARAFGKHGIPILGINLGKLGFLTEVTQNQIEDTLSRLKSDNYLIEERMALEASIPGIDAAMPALNDVVVDHGNSIRLVKTDLFCNGEFVCSYDADGVIISTPTGSTAYSLSVGGPIINPLMEAIEVSPVSPHTLTLRTIIFPSNIVLTLKAEPTDSNLRIALDGIIVAELSAGEEIIVKKADYKIKFIKFEKSSFYEVLRTKLHWGARPLFNS
jgi:NAD+ kinase